MRVLESTYGVSCKWQLELLRSLDNPLNFLYSFLDCVFSCLSDYGSMASGMTVLESHTRICT